MSELLNNDNIIIESAIDEITSIVGTISTGAKKLQAFKNSAEKSLGSKSISELSKANIMTFPVIFDGDIDSAERTVISKHFEKVYAGMMTMHLKNVFTVDAGSYSTFSDFLQSIHNSNDTPDILNYVMSLSDNVNNAMKSDNSKYASESVVVHRDVLDSLWLGTGYEFVTEVLNDKYLPSTNTTEKLESVIEASKGSSEDMESLSRISDFSKNLANQKGLKGVKNSAVKANADIGKDSSSLTTVTLSMNYNKGQVKGEATYMFGVKAMSRVIPTGDMATSLIESVKKSKLVFNIIKWSKGELNFFKDFVLGLADARKDAISNLKGGKKIDKIKSSLNHRRKNAKKFVAGKQSLSPISTLVISTTTVERVKQSTGIDLMNEKQAADLMKDWYLLGLMVYDKSNETCSVMYDFDHVYEDMTLRSINNNNKDSDLRHVSNMFSTLMGAKGGR